jgi:hypothetical protein
MDSITEKEPSEVVTPDTENATFFNPDESNRPEHFKLLRFYNRGTWKDRREENKKVRHRQDNIAILDALSGQLSLTDYQKSEARRLFDEINLQKMGHKTSLIAFCLCAILANEDVPDGHRYYPTAKNTDAEFTSMQDNLEFSDHKVLSVMGKIRAGR